MSMIIDRPFGNLTNSQRTLELAMAGVLACMCVASPARAELAISQLIVELKPTLSRAHDIEITNDSSERSFVTVEPREILDPGSPREHSAASPDPEKLGFLVSPRRLVLEPGQHRTLRLASIGPLSSSERVYRVTVKPVVGTVEGETGLKLLVGYDLLVLVRPAKSTFNVIAKRSGDSLSISNHGNESVELVDGKQCLSAGHDCLALAAKRLYAGMTWTQTLPAARIGEYRVRSMEGTSTIKF